MNMISAQEISRVVDSNLCIGCGFCQIQLDREIIEPTIAMQWSDIHEHWIPIIRAGSETTLGNRICPGASMDMRALSASVFGKQPDDPVCGEFTGIFAGYAANAEVRRNAASGGVATAIVKHLFATGSIGAVYCTLGRSPVAGVGSLTLNTTRLSEASGSHYHPINFGAGLIDLMQNELPFAFIGLPCEVAALRSLMELRPDIRKRCVVVIGLFCGGINRYSGIGYYLKRFGVEPNSVTSIDYRDGDWPGKIRAETSDRVHHIPRIHGNSRWNILHYVVSFQGYWMLPRCRICPDQIADFADISLGDPHLARFKSKKSEGYNAIVTRNAVGQAILDEVVEAGSVVIEPLSRQELVDSQGYTLQNRRQAELYAKMARMLGMASPVLTTYAGTQRLRSWHQSVYAFVDLAKIRVRNWHFLRPFYLPLQIFEYLFLTFSVRLLLLRFSKLLRGK